ncbi:putative tRNA-methyltransferase [Blattamonas nauphoetae]|uniref:tRNA (adenine(58)-N(1))-methyltransferase non-catalytic subunit TRM6 n=1 Tax=Blattamonas nauphoetae TaxID=2049346 RepID=A0ABQ9XWY9_9EUKA|nr:putative tRNA-methyltransferase [Blattamonas nauphoetae]
MAVSISEEIPPIDYSFDTKHKPIEARLDGLTSNLHHEYNRYFSELSTRFPALAGQICLEDPNPPDKISSIYNIDNHHQDFRDLMDLYTAQIEWDDHIAQRYQAELAHQADCVFDLNDALGELREMKRKQERKNRLKLQKERQKQTMKNVRSNNKRSDDIGSLPSVSGNQFLRSTQMHPIYDTDDNEPDTHADFDENVMDNELADIEEQIRKHGHQHRMQNIQKTQPSSRFPQETEIQPSIRYSSNRLRSPHHTPLFTNTEHLKTDDGTTDTSFQPTPRAKTQFIEVADSEAPPIASLRPTPTKAAQLDTPKRKMRDPEPHTLEQTRTFSNAMKNGRDEVFAEQQRQEREKEEEKERELERRREEEREQGGEREKAMSVHSRRSSHHADQSVTPPLSNKPQAPVHPDTISRHTRHSHHSLHTQPPPAAPYSEPQIASFTPHQHPQQHPRHQPDERWDDGEETGEYGSESEDESEWSEEDRSSSNNGTHSSSFSMTFQRPNLVQSVIIPPPAPTHLPLGRQYRSGPDITYRRHPQRFKEEARSSLPLSDNEISSFHSSAASSRSSATTDPSSVMLASSIVQDGDLVHLRSNIEKELIIAVNKTTSTKFGKRDLAYSQLIGKEFGATYLLNPDGTLTRTEPNPRIDINDIAQSYHNYLGQNSPPPPPSPSPSPVPVSAFPQGPQQTLTIIQSPSSQVRDNRNLIPTALSQKMAPEQIIKMKTEGAKAEEIVGALITQSATFETKTDYSKEKYIKKKLKKHQRMITILRPSAQLMCEFYFQHKPDKIAYLRPDTLAYLMTSANIRAGMKLLVFDECHGIVTASAGKKMASFGTMIRAHATKTKSDGDGCTQFLMTKQELQVMRSVPMFAFEAALLNEPTFFDSSKPLFDPPKILEPQSSSSAGSDLSHPPLIQPSPLNLSTHILSSSLNPFHSHNTQSHRIDLSQNLNEPSAALLPSSLAAAPISSQLLISTSITSPQKELTEPIKKTKREESTPSDDKTEDKEKKGDRQTDSYEVNQMNRMSNLVKTVQRALLWADSLVIASNNSVFNVFTTLYPFLSLSGSFAVYSPYQEPLNELAVYIRDNGLGVQIEISQGVMREWQIAPMRTHPTTDNVPRGGFVLSGIKVMNE